MTPRLTPRRLEFLGKLAEHGSLVLYGSSEDIPEYGLNQSDVDALVNLGLITVGEPGELERREAATTGDLHKP
ncbi:hypothetical protein [Nonomuraea aurantiaca]|uniref:hypothetical protein n=1 Tax=Nonomuraea aurantiaca TaxID=2878562 RepID=UPI001CD961E1|nr:hypothetical protein [Nonomuraea aurantiaca]MCA2227803.1 hypothetical protein [Nonomuraea aurantiaca]